MNIYIETFVATIFSNFYGEILSEHTQHAKHPVSHANNSRFTKNLFYNLLSEFYTC